MASAYEELLADALDRMGPTSLMRMRHDGDAMFEKHPVQIEDIPEPGTKEAAIREFNKNHEPAGAEDKNQDGRGDGGQFTGPEITSVGVDVTSTPKKDTFQSDDRIAGVVEDDYEDKVERLLGITPDDLAHTMTQYIEEDIERVELSASIYSEGSDAPDPESDEAKAQYENYLANAEANARGQHERDARGAHEGQISTAKFALSGIMRIGMAAQWRDWAAHPLMQPSLQGGEFKPPLATADRVAEILMAHGLIDADAIGAYLRGEHDGTGILDAYVVQKRLDDPNDAAAVAAWQELSRLSPNIPGSTGYQAADLNPGITAVLNQAGYGETPFVYDPRTFTFDPATDVKDFDDWYYDEHSLRPMDWRPVGDNPEGEATLAFYGEKGSYFKRVFTRDDYGKLSVHHDYFKNHGPDGQGKGLMRGQMEAYESLGVSTIDTQANISTGAYAWARYGFQAASPESLHNSLLDKIDGFGEDAKRALKPYLSQITDRLDDNREEARLPWTVSDMRITGRSRDIAAIARHFHVSETNGNHGFGNMSAKDAKRWNASLDADVASGSFNIGKILLAGTSWDAVFDMEDDDQRARLKTYIGDWTHKRTREAWVREAALYEFNKCHNPEGDGGGQFCATGPMEHMPPGFLEGSLIKAPLYHGTDRDVSKGLSPNLGAEHGIFLSPSRRYAGGYGSNLHKVLVNVQRPYIVEGKYAISPKDLTPADAARLQAQGYDSVVVSHNGQLSGAQEVVVFDPAKAYLIKEARVREFNDCNLPAGDRDGGRFGANADPRCGDTAQDSGGGVSRGKVADAPTSREGVLDEVFRTLDPASRAKMLRWSFAEGHPPRESLMVMDPKTGGQIDLVQHLPGSEFGDHLDHVAEMARHSAEANAGMLRSKDKYTASPELYERTGAALRDGVLLGVKQAVPVPDAIRDAGITFHTHPSSRTFSFADIGIALDSPHKVLGVLGRDGSEYAMRVFNRGLVSAGLAEASEVMWLSSHITASLLTGREQRRGELDPAFFDAGKTAAEAKGWDVQMVNASIHGMMLTGVYRAMQDQGWIAYGERVSEARQAEYALHTHGKAEHIAETIRAAFNAQWSGRTPVRREALFQSLLGGRQRRSGAGVRRTTTKEAAAALKDAAWAALVEFNKCHNPEGEDGGQFCSADGTMRRQRAYPEIEYADRSDPRLANNKAAGIFDRKTGKVVISTEFKDSPFLRDHEVGHALLDGVQPPMWAQPMVDDPEVWDEFLSTSTGKTYTKYRGGSTDDPYSIDWIEAGADLHMEWRAGRLKDQPKLTALLEDHLEWAASLTEAQFREYNKCHNPEGEGGGQFCNTAGIHSKAEHMDAWAISKGYASMSDFYDKRLGKTGPEDPKANAIPYEEFRGHEKAWERMVDRAIALGVVDPEGAEKIGHYVDGNVSVGGGYKPLPPELFHVATASTAIMQTGLRSREELGQMSGTGLGGGEDTSISFTADLKTARAIRQAMLEAHDVATGKLTVERLIQMAKESDPHLRARGQKGDKSLWGDQSFYKGFMQMVGGGANWKEGDPLPTRLQHHLTGASGIRALEQEDRDRLIPLLTGVGAASGWVAEDALRPVLPPEYVITKVTEDPHIASGRRMVWLDNIKRYATPQEKRREAFDIYKTWAFARDAAGGKLDPLFFSSDPEALAKVPRREIRILKFKPRTPKSKGYQVSSLGEWRIKTGDAVKYAGIAEAKAPLREFNPCHEPEGDKGGQFTFKGTGNCDAEGNPTFAPFSKARGTVQLHGHDRKDKWDAAIAQRVLGDHDPSEIALGLVKYFNEPLIIHMGTSSMRGSDYVRLHAGAPSGTWFTRVFRRHPDGTLTIDHEHFENHGADEQGKGLMQGQMEVYEKLGAETIHTTANISTGAYAWARYGFTSSNPEAFAATIRERMATTYPVSNPLSRRTDAQRQAAINAAGGRFSSGMRAVLAPYEAQIEAALANADPTTPWKIADLRITGTEKELAPLVRAFAVRGNEVFNLSVKQGTRWNMQMRKEAIGGSFNLGRVLLAGLAWEAKLTLADKPAMRRLRAYLRGDTSQAKEAAIREFNKCHNPAGDGGGEFCSDPLTRQNLGGVLDDLRRSEGLGITLMANLAKYDGLPKSLHIQLIAIDSSLRGRGRGTRIMDKVERLAAHNDLIVTLSAATPRSKAFFAKRGYVLAPSERDPGFMYLRPTLKEAAIREFNKAHEPKGAADKNQDGKGDGGQFAKKETTAAPTAGRVKSLYDGQDYGMTQKHLGMSTMALAHAFAKNLDEDVYVSIEGNTTSSQIQIHMEGVAGPDRMATKITRYIKIHPTTGKPYLAYHEVFRNVGHDGQGKGLMKAQVELYDALGIRAIRTSANINTGAYAWARYGFQAEEPAEFFNMVRNRIDRYERRHYSSVELNAAIDALAPYIPKMRRALGKGGSSTLPWKIADLRLTGTPAELQPLVDAFTLHPTQSTAVSDLLSLFPDKRPKEVARWNAALKREAAAGEFNLGRVLLTGTSWDAVMDLKHPKSRARLKAYIGV